MEVTETPREGCTNLQDHKDRPPLGSSQEIPARAMNPLKLMALLREEFGLGRYEISVSKDCSIGKLLACGTVLTTTDGPEHLQHSDPSSTLSRRNITVQMCLA
jgi:hypothetical protein